MSQHDMDVANGSGAAVRADLNLALLALASCNSGATAPATTFAYMLWPDTSTGLLKQRNAANSAWVTVCQLSDWSLPSVQGQLATAFTTGGSSTAYTLTPTPAITANTTNQRFRVTFHTASGATPTLAVSGQTAKNLKYKDPAGTKQAITAVQVPTSWVSDVEYDGTDWVVLQPVGVMTATVGGKVPTPPNNTTTFLRGDGTFAAPAAGLTSGTAVASTSGTSIDFTSIPAGTKRITFNFAALSTNGTSLIILQLGDSGGIENTGYTGTIETASSRYSFTDGFKLIGAGATTWALDGRIVLELLDAATNTWTATINISGDNAAGVAYVGAGAKSLTATLNQIRLTTQGGADTFDAGKVNILYE